MKINRFADDVFRFITLNLNPISLERKLNIQNNKNYVNMMWDICILQELYKFDLVGRKLICLESTGSYL